MSKTHKTKIKAIAGLTLLAGGGGGLSLICPKVSADSTFEVVVPDKPMLEIELDQNNIRLEMDPTLTKPDFKAKTLTITSSTNNQSGYTVYMSTDNTSLVRTEALPNGDIPEIKSLELRESGHSYGDYDELDFTVNSWGYRPDSLGYVSWKPIPRSGYSLMVDRNSDAIISKNAQVSFAAKVDATQPAGSYTGTINFSIVTNSPTVTSFNSAMASAGKSKVSVNNEEYYKMQDMTPEICSNVSTDETTRLVDVRDNKVYWILKGRDENCWMTQNLDHNIVTTENFYTPENTDIRNRTWNPVRATVASSNVSEDGVVTGWEQDPNSPYSLDVGDWYWNQNGGWYNGTNCGYDQSTHTIGGCGAGPGTETFGFTTGRAQGHFSQTITESPLEGVNINEYHKHVGNYYNWAAAHARNGDEAYEVRNSDIYSGNNGIDVGESICPAGWRLPGVGHSSDDTVELDDFNNLLKKYDAEPYEYSSENPSGYSKTDENMIRSPLYFVRGGMIKDFGEDIEDDPVLGFVAGGNRLYKLGDAGYYITGTDIGAGSIGGSFSNVLYFNFDSVRAGGVKSFYTSIDNIIHYGNQDEMGYGYSIRCMAR